MSLYVAGDKENQEAFHKHFERDLQEYGRLAIVNVVDQTGKEKVMADTYLNHILQLDSQSLTYIAFDFHEYCRGMKFENISILIDNIKDIIKEMRYCWADKKGIICEQLGIFRVNCIDCLDRTNIVQSAIAKIILETQCRKLGLLPPDEQLPSRCRALYQQMWANNGDVISRQYAGTAALKGDYTRTGERKFAGMMRDGMNSANRYYINRVKDVYRQATIDLMLGHTVTEDMIDAATSKTESEEILVEKEENLKTLIDECKKMLITEPEHCLGGWGLIDCDPVWELMLLWQRFCFTLGGKKPDISHTTTTHCPETSIATLQWTGDPTQQDMDIILLVSQRAYYVANYDDDVDQVTSYQKIYLEDLEKVEIGPAPALFKSKHLCIRFHYNNGAETGFFHTFRPTQTRLFNNIIITIKNEEEARESLRAICESFSAAQKLMSLDLQVDECPKLERKRTRPHVDVIDIASQFQMDTLTQSLPLSRDNSSSNLRSLVPPVKRTALDISRLGRTFATFNPIRKVRFSRLRPPRASQFVPAVMYNKDSDLEEHDTNSLERAKILKGDHIVTATETFTSESAEDLLKLDGLDGFITNDLGNDLGIDNTEKENDVILESCGILAAPPCQLINSLIQGQKAASADALYMLKKRTATFTIDDYQPKKEKFALKPKSRSLDIDERVYGSVDRLQLSDRKVVGILSPQMEEMSAVVSTVTNPASVPGCSDDSVFYPSADEPNKDDGSCNANSKPTSNHVDESRQVTSKLPPDGSSLLDDGDQGSLISQSQDDQKHNLTKDDVNDMELAENTDDAALVKNAGKDAGRDDAGILSRGDDLLGNGHDAMPSGESSGKQDTPDMVEVGEEVHEGVIEDMTQDPSQGGSGMPGVDTKVWFDIESGELNTSSSAALYHPCMKVSFSDGSISYHNDMVIDQYGGDDPQNPGALAGPNAFSKFRVKMSNLQLPTIPSQQDKRRVAEEMAVENKVKSQLRFRECKTRIILL